MSNPNNSSAAHVKVTTAAPIEISDLSGLTRSERDTFAEILRDIKGAADSIQRAAGKWVTLPTATRAKILREIPRTWRIFLDRLSRVGDGTLHPQLYHASGNAARYLGRLPLLEQDRYIRELIPVVVVSETSGRRDVRNMDVEDMSDFQRRTVFAANGDIVTVRTVEQQKAWLELQKRREERKEQIALGNLTTINRPGRWKVEKGVLYVSTEKAKAGLTKRDVQQMLRDLSA